MKRNWPPAFDIFLRAFVEYEKAATVTGRVRFPEERTLPGINIVSLVSEYRSIFPRLTITLFFRVFSRNSLTILQNLRFVLYKLRISLFRRGSFARIAFAKIFHLLNF